MRANNARKLSARRPRKPFRRAERNKNVITVRSATVRDTVFRLFAFRAAAAAADENRILIRRNAELAKRWILFFFFFSCFFLFFGSFFVFNTHRHADNMCFELATAGRRDYCRKFHVRILLYIIYIYFMCMLHAYAFYAINVACAMRYDSIARCCKILL
jgi:hypothetical protein